MTFRPLLTNSIDEHISAPEDLGYKYRCPGNTKVVTKTLQDNGFVSTKKKNWAVMWIVGRISMDMIQSLKSHQRINYFPKAHEITKKNKLSTNLSAMKNKFKSEYSFVPKTFLLPQDLILLMKDSEKGRKSGRKRVYICKPNGLSQGRGIYLTDDIQEIIDKKITNCLVSQYISDPLLINGLKFDLRIYALLTSVDPLRIYIYQEGLARFATEKYTLAGNSLSNKFIHLTNFSINKKSEKFKNEKQKLKEEGTNAENKYKWSLSSLKEFMKKMGLNSDLMSMRIEDIIVKTLISIERQLFKAYSHNSPFRNNCFQVFGFDILIDSKLNPWLIEVNLSPSLGCSSPLDFEIKSKLVADTLTMVGVEPIDNRKNSKFRMNFGFLRDKSDQNKFQGRHEKEMSI